MMEIFSMITKVTPSLSWRKKQLVGSTPGLPFFQRVFSSDFSRTSQKRGKFQHRGYPIAGLLNVI
jgi:hypothetical protein